MEEPENQPVVFDVNEQIWHMKMAGFSFPEISARVEIPVKECIKRYRRFHVKLAKSWGLDSREQMRQLDLMRLEVFSREPYKYAAAGSVDHIKIMLDIIKTRSALNQGYGVDPNSETGKQQIFLVTGDREAFVEALRKGRELPSAGPDRDDEGE